MGNDGFRMAGAKPMKARYWIAINGSSCAMSSIPWEYPSVNPVPHILIGFPAFREAEEAQRFCLTAPVADLRPQMALWESRARTAGDIMISRPHNPQPQTSGSTTWCEATEIPF